MEGAKLRVVRPTDQLNAVVRFYRDGVGLDVLTQFENDDGLSAAIIGHRGAPWHLAFTHRRGHEAGRAPNQGNPLVIYLPDRAEWSAAVDRMRALGLTPVASLYPYWDLHGVTFEDPDGYRVVLQNAAWDR